MKMKYFTIDGACKLMYLIFSPQLLEWIERKRISLYSRWVKNAFSKCGAKVTFGGFAHLIGAKYAVIGDGCFIGKGVVLEIRDHYGNGQHFSPSFSMGNNSSIGEHGHVTCINSIKIANNVRMGRKVFITDNAHGASSAELLDIAPNYRPLYSKGPIVIEDCVWIGEMVCIMPGVTIGKGSIIGANAVVTKDIPPYCMAAGNPARVIKSMVH